MTPQTYNAYYDDANNEIVLPAAIFTVPGVQDKDLDDALVYGYAAASTIGHEITHGFDDEGRRFDAAGNLKDWWTARDAARFQQRAATLIEQFNAYEPVPGLHINGQASLGENLADYGGVLLGLDAFKKTAQYREGVKVAGSTPLQRYFLGYALSWARHDREELLRNDLLRDMHAPPQWRVNGPLANVLIKTPAELFLEALHKGTVSTNVILRRIHNFALDMDWIPKAIIPKRKWPKIEFNAKRAITSEEHQAVLAQEKNPEYYKHYQLLWHLDGSQSDVANLCAENVDWQDRTIAYFRMKTGSRVMSHFGKSVVEILKTLPQQGPLFPRIRNSREADRATYFKRRCLLRGVSGVTLHSYRNVWGYSPSSFPFQNIPPVNPRSIGLNSIVVVGRAGQVLIVRHGFVQARDLGCAGQIEIAGFKKRSA
jgi:hypothetical protein